jgi:hypothetical protein
MESTSFIIGSMSLVVHCSSTFMLEIPCINPIFEKLQNIRIRIDDSSDVLDTCPLISSVKEEAVGSKNLDKSIS